MSRLSIFQAWLFLAVLFIPVIARSYWPTEGIPITVAPLDQHDPVIVSDGEGGAIITWYDYRSGISAGNADIYAQRIDGAGNAMWTPNGVAVCTAPRNQNQPVVASDGNGGAIIVWQDLRGDDLDLFAQRIDALGNQVWTPNGISICASTGQQQDPNIVGDGLGGAIIAWADKRNGAADIFAQRVDATGAPIWTAGGVAVNTASGSQEFPELVSDDAGGAIVAWHDWGSGLRVYAQRLGPAGDARWTGSGIPVCPTSNSQRLPQIVRDGEGGAIIAWLDSRSGTNQDIYAQHMDANGSRAWGLFGVAICTANESQNYVRLASDGFQGAVIAWEDFRNGTGKHDIYAQRVDAIGNPVWLANGIAVCAAEHDQYAPEVTSDDNGGAFITWHDLRALDMDMYTQRVDASGESQFVVDGVLVGEGSYPRPVRDAVGGLIIAFQIYHSSTNQDIYARHVSHDGLLATDVDDTPSLAPTKLHPNVPNPFNPATTIRFEVADGGADVKIVVFDVAGGLVRTLLSERRDAGPGSVEWNGRDDAGREMASGVYFYRMRAGGFEATRKMILLK